MKLKYLMITGVLTMSLSVAAQESKKPVEKPLKPQVPVIKLDPEQVKQQKLENLIRSIINRCDPFPKCL